ncbi:MAG: hypothetical protein CM15mV32_0470 [Caudoviricetes sp.]|nr:MAG: hypothetical protein CM15mV32_0470 [Caudoviricetes sp.]
MNPLTYKDKPVNASTVGNAIKSKVGDAVKSVGKYITKNPGKAALIGAGVIGAGMLAKKAFI